MTKVINNTIKNKKKRMANYLVNNEEVRSLNKWIHNKGEYRDGLTEYDGGVKIPYELLNTAEDLSSNKFKLRNYVSTIPVNTGRGSMMVLDPTATAKNKDQLAKYPDMDSDLHNVEFNIQTMGGRLAISNEMIEDSQSNLLPLLTRQIGTIENNTINKAIMDKVSSLPTDVIHSLDDLVGVLSDIDPRFQQYIFCGQTAYGQLRTLKDTTGRYLLNDNNTFMGLQVIVVPNYAMNDPHDLFIGSLQDSTALFDRLETTLQYNQNSIFGTALCAIMRFDVELTYPDALRHLELSLPADKKNPSNIHINGGGSNNGSNGSKNGGSNGSKK